MLARLLPRPAATPPVTRADLFALRPVVLEWLRRWRSNLHDREDLAQEIMISAHGTFDNFNPEKGSLRAWLYVITIREAYAWVRRDVRKRNNGILDPGEAALVPYRGPSPEDALTSRIALLVMLHLLKDMDSRLLSILLAFDVEGRTHEEIAQEFQIDIGTSKSRLHRARKKAREILEPERKRGIFGALLLFFDWRWFGSRRGSSSRSKSPGSLLPRLPSFVRLPSPREPADGLRFALPSFLFGGGVTAAVMLLLAPTVKAWKDLPHPSNLVQMAIAPAANPCPPLPPDCFTDPAPPLVAPPPKAPLSSPRLSARAERALDLLLDDPTFSANGSN